MVGKKKDNGIEIKDVNKKSGVNSKSETIKSNVLKKSKTETKKELEKKATENVNGVDQTITVDDLSHIRSKKDLLKLIDPKKANRKRIFENIAYEKTLEKLQIELVKLQQWVQNSGARIVVLFEGRDAAGKGGTIRRFTEHMNPRALKVVALAKPTHSELGQWYFQRYINQLPNAGEIAFFDRSWYNRAVVEPVMGFCDDSQYATFMQQVPEFEHMLYEVGITVIKFWFSISREEQLKRFKSRMSNPLKQWKISPVDKVAQEKWDKYTKYKENMFSKTHNSFCPWIIVKANDKKRARLESIRYVLSAIPYAGKEKSKVSLHINPNVVNRYHRKITQIDK